VVAADFDEGHKWLELSAATLTAPAHRPGDTSWTTAGRANYGSWWLTSVKTELIVTVAISRIVLGAAVTVLYSVVRDTIVEY
jgi:hypothetical protein